MPKPPHIGPLPWYYDETWQQTWKNHNRKKPVNLRLECSRCGGKGYCSGKGLKAGTYYYGTGKPGSTVPDRPPYTCPQCFGRGWT